MTVYCPKCDEVYYLVTACPVHGKPVQSSEHKSDA